MSTTDLVLRFELSSNPNADARTLQVLQIVDQNTAGGGQSTIALYKVRPFSTAGCCSSVRIHNPPAVSPSEHGSNHWRDLDPTNKHGHPGVGERGAHRLVVKHQRGGLLWRRKGTSTMISRGWGIG